MDSTSEDEARKAKRARLTPSGGGVDIISDVNDDVLLRILELVPDARDAARIGTLSRRWHGLWSRVPVLRFTSRPVLSTDSAAKRYAALRRYVSAVDDILARRARSDCAIQSLVISCWTHVKPAEYSSVWPTKRSVHRERLASFGALQRWMQYVFQHGLKSFIVDLHLYRRFHYEDDGDPKDTVVHFDGLPSPARLETIHLSLSFAKLRLPSNINFASLTDISLEMIEIVGAGGRYLLEHLVSSACCPRLQKLRLDKIFFDRFIEELRFKTDVLSELWVEGIAIKTLELETPNLRVLHIGKCPNEVIRVSAPRLEEFALFQQRFSTRWLEVNSELSRMRSLKISLWSHGGCASGGYRETQNNMNLLLLDHCSSLTCLDVTLDVGDKAPEDIDIIRCRVPHLHGITSLTVHVSPVWFRQHNYAASVASLLTRFINLRSLSLHLSFFNRLWYKDIEGPDLECGHQDDWISNDISMSRLHTLEFTGLSGTNCELWFMKAMLTSAKTLHKVSIKFYPKCRQHQGKMDAFERMLHDEGMWTSHRDTFLLSTCMDL